MTLLHAAAIPARDRIARRAAKELRDGDCVNLGVGMPTLVADFIPAGIEVLLHSENGLLGMGPSPPPERIDADLVNARREAVTMKAGSAVFSIAESYSMIRGGHVDLAILGAIEVSEHGDLANWTMPSEMAKMAKGMCGAMDLAAGARRVVVVMNHTANDGSPKILTQCRLALTGRAVIHRILTELAVIDVTADGLLLREVAAGVSAREVQEKTEPTLRVSPDISTMSF